MNKYILPASVTVIIALAVVFFYLNGSSVKDQERIIAPEVISSRYSTEKMRFSKTSKYTNGTYQDEGNYVSPGGPRTISLSVTLEDGVITKTDFTGLADDPTSKIFQKEFGDNYQKIVIGKNIDEVELDKVAGSSLTPIGFNDALRKIKQQAQS